MFRSPKRMSIASEEHSWSPRLYGPQGWNHRWKSQALLMIGDESLRGFVKTNSIQSLEKQQDPEGGSTWKMTLKPNKAGVVQYSALSLSSRNHYLISMQESRMRYDQGKQSTARARWSSSRSWARDWSCRNE